MRREYSDAELRALILDWLVRRGRWEAHYFPLDTLVNRLSHVVKNDGKRIRRSLKDLVQQGYLLVHKGGETISLEPSMNRDILEYVKTVLKL